MRITKFQGNVASDVAHWQEDVAESIGGNRPLVTMPDDDIFAKSGSAEDARESDRARERRKWIWQMSTIVVMGISGLCLHFLIKSIPRDIDTAAITTVALSSKDYCSEGGQVYALDSSAGAKSALTQKCSATDRVTQRDATLNEK